MEHLKALNPSDNTDQLVNRHFTEKVWPNSRLASLVEDLLLTEGGEFNGDPEDFERTNVNDLDRSDMLSIVTEWVDAGIKRGDWTFKKWLSDTKENY